MKLITLNTWGGKVYGPLLEFFRANRDVDIFCLQEVYHSLTEKIPHDEFETTAPDLFSDIAAALPGHTGYFHPSIGDYYGLAIFTKQPALESGDTPVYTNPDWRGHGNHSRNLDYVTVSAEGKTYLVANVHGLWTGQDKRDNPDRLTQSRKILDFLTARIEPKILCGDFNLRPDTESVRMLEQQQLRNLITEYGIASTRSSLYQKIEKFADFIFTGPEIEVQDFKVLPDVVSDHSPLFLEFS